MASKPIIIPDNAPVYSKEQFIIPAHYEEDISSILIPGGLIKNRIEKVAREIYDEYRDKNLHFLYVLEGAFKFFSKIQDYYMSFQSNNPNTNPFSFGSIGISSYENDKSTGDIKINDNDKLKNLSGKDVLIIEDIVDTGRSMNGYTKENGQKVKGLLQHIQQYNPASIKVASLLLKRTPKSNGYIPDFIGFSIPKKFVVGYGLDYNEHLRDIPHICIISDIGKKKYSVKNKKN